MTPAPEDRIGSPRDEPEFEPVEARPPRRSWGKRLSVMIVLIAGGVVGWHFLDVQIGLNEQTDMPVVRAEVAPVKIKPADPGGLDVPDRDKLVYDRLNGEGAGTDVERLLPPPEEPMELSEPETVTEKTAVAEEQPSGEAAAPVSLEPSASASRATNAEEAPPPPPAPVKDVEATGLSAATPPPEPAPTPAEAEIAAPPASQPETTETAAATPAGGEQYRIQLAALRTRASAESEWNRLKKAHPDILGSFRLFVVMIDKGGTDGIYYRLQAGNMPSRDAAKTVCDKLAGRNVACLVKSPDS